MFYILILTLTLVLILVYLISTRKNSEDACSEDACSEEDYWDYSGYNYPQENPNAVVSGTPISGTVYVSEPKNNTGMGWIL